MDGDGYLFEFYSTPEKRIHVFTGTTQKPRSIMIEVNNGVIEEPKRVPTMSLEVLAERYVKQPINLDEFQFSIQFLISLLSSVNKIRRRHFTKGNTINQLIKKHKSLIRMFDGKARSKPIPVDLFPVTKALTVSSELVKSEEFDLFVRVVSKPCRHSRQKSLTQLISIKSVLSRILSHWLLFFRTELTAAVIREYGRQEINDQYILDKCSSTFINSEDKGLQKYSFWYLYKYSPEIIENNLRKKDLTYLANQATNYENITLWNNIQSKYYSDIEDNSNALQLLSLLDDSTPSRIEDIVDLHHRFMKVEKEIARPFRRAIMNLLKQCEITHNPHLLAAITALSLLGQTYSIKDEKMILDLGPFGFEMRYIHRRIRKLLELWLLSDKTERILNFTTNLFLYHPSIQIEKFAKKNSEKYFFQWLDLHPIFKIITVNYEDLFRQWGFISRLYVHLGDFPNEILIAYLEKKSTRRGRITADEILSVFDLFMISRLPFISTNDIVVEIGQKLIDPYIKYRSDKFISDIVDFAVSRGLILDETIFYAFAKMIFSGRRVNSNLITLYISTHQDNSAITAIHLDLLFDIIDEYFSSGMRIPHVEEFLYSQIVHLPGLVRSTPEIIGYKIDALKIIYKDLMEEFDLENWQPLSIETVTTVYRYSSGDIPSFIEGTISYAFSKPDWEQLARHYLAMGLQRPNRTSLAESQLKRVPNHLTRDILGQIALVNQTIAYCERNGFTDPLENLIIQNIYKRGWNIERRLERTIASLFGSISPRLRSYFAAYLVTEQSEVNEDILELAREVENQQIRDRIIRSLERYATASIWFTLAESYHPDMQEQAIEQIKLSRLSTTERSKIIKELINASRPKLRELGRDWLLQHGLQKDDLIALLYNPYIDCWDAILDYLQSRRIDYKEEYDTLMANFLSRILWYPQSKKTTRDSAVDLIGIIKQERIKTELKHSLAKLSLVSIKSRAAAAIAAYTSLEETV